MKNKLIRLGKSVNLTKLIVKVIEINNKIIKQQQKKYFYNKGLNSYRNYSYKKN